MNNQYGQPPGFPPQQPAQPAQQPQHPQGYPQQQQAPQDAQGAPPSLPQVYLPDEAVIAAAQQKAVAEAERAAKARAGQFGGSGWKFFRPEGPNGTKFAQAPIGYAATYRVWILPSPRPGEMPYIEDESIFYKSQQSPQGKSIGASPIIAESRKVYFRSGDETKVQWAQDRGRARKQYIYQIALLDHYQSHFNEEGQMVPYVFRANATVHKAITDLLAQNGAARIIDPMHGRALILSKKKTGASNMDVEWTCSPDLEQQPMPQQFWPLLTNLQDTRKLLKNSSAQDIYTALVEMQLPITAEIQSMLVAQQAQEQQQQAAAAVQQPAAAAPPNGMSYTPGHAPPAPSPYPPAPANPYQQAAPPQQAYQPQATAPVAPQQQYVDPGLAAFQQQVKG